MRRTSSILACVSAVSLLAVAASVSAQERVIPSETYTADLIGPSTVDSFAERQARGVDETLPADGGVYVVPRAPSPEVPAGETIPQTAGAGELSGSPPTLGLNFEGTRIEDTICVNPNFPCIPPDTMGAIGPDHFMEVINGNVRIFLKSNGQQISTEPLVSFFSGIIGRIGDPRVVFDHHSGRWIVIATTFEGGKIALAVSSTNDPTESFLKTHFVADAGSDAGAFVDYPTLGVDENGIYIGATMFWEDPDRWTQTIFAIEKAPLIAFPASLGTVTAWRDLEPSLGNQPAHTYGTPGSEYIIGVSTTSALRIYRVDGPLDNPTMTDTGTLSVPSFGEPPDAPALGSTNPIDTIDNRLMMSVYRDGSLWTTHGIDVDNRAAVRWYEIDPVTRTVIQSGNVDDPSLYFYFPSLMVNSAGHVAMGFSGSDASRYIGSYYTGRRPSDTPGDMAVPQVLKAGEAPYIEPFSELSSLSYRWGDYSYTTLDPVDEMTFWTIQEYAETPVEFEGAWGTWIGVLGVVPCTLPGDCDDTNECTIDDCVDGFCAFKPVPNETLCSGSVCCYGACACSSDADCDDGNDCTTDTCMNDATCDAFCEHTWPACLLGELDGCCGPTCTWNNDLDCRCGDGVCDPPEIQCNCPEDCGTPPANEVPGSTCQDGIDNDCDGFVDCDDAADCASDSACFCDDNGGNSPLVCIYWNGPVPPVPGTNFVFDFVSDPDNPGVTFFTGNDGWRIWSQVSWINNAPANLGHIRIDPTLPTENFSVTIAHGASAGAANVASIGLVDVGWTGQSNLSGGSISGDLMGDLVLQESGGQGGVASFTIGGDLHGNITIPSVDTLRVNGAVFGDLFFPNGLPLGAEVSIQGLLTDTASVNFNGQDLAGLLSLTGGSAPDSVINAGALVAGRIELLNGTYRGSVTVASTAGLTSITIWDADLSGSVNILVDHSGILSLAGGELAAEGVISIGGNLAASGFGLIEVIGDVLGSIVVLNDVLGQIDVTGNLAGHIHVNGHIAGFVDIGGDVTGEILANADSFQGGDITGNVTVHGIFDGNICGDNLSAVAPLPLGVDIVQGPNATICGEVPCPLIEDYRGRLVYVDISASGLDDGSSWENAYTSFQQAINRATFSSDAIDVWVADGVYVPTEETNPLNPRTMTFSLPDRTLFHGGFAGGESQRCGRLPGVNEVVLSGDLNGDDLPGFVNIGDNAYHVVTANGVGATAVLDGVTITAGNADSPTPLGETGPRHAGGGLLNIGGAPTLRNCRFTDNAAMLLGGAVYNGSLGSPSLFDCLFLRNQTSNGWGGAFSSNTGSPTLVNCRFIQNSAFSVGGAVSLEDVDDAEFTNCLFDGNQTTFGSGAGGAIYHERSSLTVTNCTLSQNSAANTGGIYSSATPLYNFSHKLTVTNSILWGNTDSGTSTLDAQISGGYRVVTFSDVQDDQPNDGIVYPCTQSGCTGGVTNLDVDPQFTNPLGLDGVAGTEDDNLRLFASSPCIERGNSGVVTAQTDLDGNPRKHDADGNALATVDMGAYESQCQRTTSPTIDDQVESGYAKNRYLSILGNEVGDTTLRVTLTDYRYPSVEGRQWWVGGPPVQVCENSGHGFSVTTPNCGPAPGAPQKWFWAAPLVCDASAAHAMGWSWELKNYCTGSGESCTTDPDCANGTCGVDGVVHIFGPEIASSRYKSATDEDFPTVYEIQAIDVACLTNDESHYTAPLAVQMARWGDIVDIFDGSHWTAPDGEVEIVSDVVAILAKFSNNLGAPIKSRADIDPEIVDALVTISDVNRAVAAFSGADYPFTDPCDCDVSCP